MMSLKPWSFCDINMYKQVTGFSDTLTVAKDSKTTATGQEGK